MLWKNLYINLSIFYHSLDVTLLDSDVFNAALKTKNINNKSIKEGNMKQVILIRQDLKLPKGKLAVQCCHASLEAALESSKKMLNEWRSHGSKKVVLKVKDEAELFSFYEKARSAGLKPILIRDAGKTVLKPGTATAVAIGPDDEEKIDSITGKLKMI